MKKLLSVIALTLVAVILFGITAFAESGYAYNDSVLAAFAPKWEKIQADETVISLTPGGTVGEMRFAWLSGNKDADVSFRISENVDMTAYKEISVETSDAIYDYNSNKVTVTGLEEGKTY